MILATLTDSKTIEVDKNFSFQIIHDSKAIATSSGFTKFIDRGFSTYEATLTYTNAHDDADEILTFLQENQDQIITATIGEGEEIFGPHLDYSGNLFVLVTEIQPASRINLVQSSFTYKLTLYTSDKSTPPSFKAGVVPTIANLKYPTNYQAQNTSGVSYARITGLERTPTLKKYSSLVMDGSFTLIDSELAELLAFWETNRHQDFATPSLLAHLFIPYSTPEKLILASVRDVRKLNRFLWEASVSFVPSDYTQPVPTYTLDYLDEAEISLFTVDGSNGMSSYQLTPIFSDAGDHANECDWTSSNTGAFTVSGSGLVTCVGAGDSTITCSFGGVDKTCAVTGYATMPSVATRKTIKGGSGPYDPAGSAWSAYASFESSGRIASNDGVLLGIQSNISNSFISAYTAYSDDAINNFINPWRSASTMVERRLYSASGGFLNRKFYSFGPAVASGSFTSEFAFADETAYIDGVSYAETLILDDNPVGGVGAGTNTLVWANVTRKIWEASVSNGQSLASMRTPSNCLTFYCPQDYIRYTDRTVDAVVRVNYTRIPNRGTSGSSYDLVANNVPAGWFAV